MRREDGEGGHENGERWLLTYSDLITLLLALFIILYTMSSVDLKKFEQLSKYLKVAFNHAGNEEVSLPDSLDDYIIDTSSNTDSNSSNNNIESSTDSSYPLNAGLEEIYKQISQFVIDNQLQDKIDLSKTANELKITLRDTVLFYPNSPNMLPTSEPIMKVIEESVKEVYSKVDHITISGHTADPNHDGKFSSQAEWDLSVNRAVSVLKYLNDSGLPSDKISIEGNSHFKPIASNDNPTESAKNRRVEITIRKEAK